MKTAVIRLQPEDVAEIRDNYFRLRLHSAAGQQQAAGASESIHVPLLSLVSQWIRRNAKPPFAFAGDQTLGIHRVDDTCYCNRCIERRNKPNKIRTDFRDSMLNCGFTDVDSAKVREDLRERIGTQLYDDALFLLERIHSLPDTKMVSSRRWFRPDHLAVVQPSPELFQSNRAIASLRADKRSVNLPISHGTSHGRGNYQNTVFSTRVKTDFAADGRRPVPFQTRPEKFHNKCVDLCPTTTPPIWTKPRHDFDYGDLSKFDSGWLGGRPTFAPNPLEWRDDEGEREYSSVSEPTPEEIKRWKKLHTKKDGTFKKAEYKNEVHRLQQMVSKQKFNARHASEAVVAKIHGRLGIMFGRPYQGQLQVPLYQDPNTLDDMFPTRIDSVEQVAWNSSIRPLAEYPHVPCYPHNPAWAVPEDKVTNIRPLKGIIGKSDQKLMLYEFSWESTRQERFDAEEALKVAADYDPKLHAELGHLYQYGYRYYPADRNMSEIFSETRNTMSQPKSRDIHAEVRAEWDTAIRVTFGVTPLGDARQTPPSGFYVIHRMSEQATTRVYLVLPSPPPPDAWDDEEGPVYLNKDTGELGDPQLIGKPDIQAQIRQAAAAVRSKHVNEMTVRRRLGERVFVSDYVWQMTHIRFYQQRDKLRWDLGYTSDVFASA